MWLPKYAIAILFFSLIFIANGYADQKSNDAHFKYKTSINVTKEKKNFKIGFATDFVRIRSGKSTHSNSNMQYLLKYGSIVFVVNCDPKWCKVIYLTEYHCYYNKKSELVYVKGLPRFCEGYVAKKYIKIQEGYRDSYKESDFSVTTLSKENYPKLADSLKSNSFIYALWNDEVSSNLDKGASVYSYGMKLRYPNEPYNSKGLSEKRNKSKAKSPVVFNLEKKKEPVTDQVKVKPVLQPIKNWLSKPSLKKEFLKEKRSSIYLFIALGVVALIIATIFIKKHQYSFSYFAFPIVIVSLGCFFFYKGFEKKKEPCAPPPPK